MSGRSTSSGEWQGKRPEVFLFNPLFDSRWSEFIRRHPSASIFHSVGWLRSLHDTYGYQPLVITTSKPSDPLSNGIVFCHIESWVTGSRLVSLPFSDHCEPLLSGEPRELEWLTDGLRNIVRKNKFNYIEVRPLSPIGDGLEKIGHFERHDSHCIHQLALDREFDQLFKTFHKSCVQRNIRKAERFGLTYEVGNSEDLLTKFYGIFIGARRRHRVPPQSVRWFRNLRRYLGDQIKFRVVSRDNDPVAAIVTCQYRDTVVYKYGCSKVKANKLGGISLLLWRAIQDSKLEGALTFDFGRSDIRNEGLIAFKNHWGTVRSPLSYFRYSIKAKCLESGWRQWVLGKSCEILPDSLLESLGSVLYKHAG